VIVIDGVTVCDVYHTDQLINARTVDVFAREVVIAVVFGDNVTSVIYVPGSTVAEAINKSPGFHKDLSGGGLLENIKV
jgi:hypothetical protein